jgi:4-alpha-glucanotransferase
MSLFNWLNQRSSGTLLHPTSFPGTQGCGVLDKAVDDWLDFLAEAEIHYWQVCPLGPTGFGDSPYQCFSAFAGNPYLIDLAALKCFGLIDNDDLAALAALPQDYVDFGALYQTKIPILLRAFERFQHNTPTLPYGDFAQFRQQHASWLDAYALFMALKDAHQGKPWWEWPPALRFYECARQADLPGEVRERAAAHAFFQYLFFGQWQAVHERARQRGIEIIGDAPIFVARDSADVWAHPQLFLIDQVSGTPHKVAGVPPDYFSADGQLWGNPLYDWPQHSQTGFAWWIERLRANFALCDVLRIDHFRAFDRYWEIPASAATAREGEWKNGPGIAFFKAVARALPGAQLIAEDLGELSPSVHELRQACGLPGMVILQFAFGGEADNSYLPHHHQTNSIVYPGTHDNNTTRGWHDESDEKTRDHVRRYLRISGQDIAWDFIRSAYASPCNLAIIPLQDFMTLDASARFNTPGTPSGNWQWRYTHAALAELRARSAKDIQQLGKLYGRNTFG